MAPQLSQEGASVWNEANCSLRESVEVDGSERTTTRSIAAALAELPLRFEACLAPPWPLPLPLPEA